MAAGLAGWYEEMARGRGFEPRLEAPKAPVLPLDDPRRRICSNQYTLFYQTMLLQPIKKFKTLKFFQTSPSLHPSAVLQ